MFLPPAVRYEISGTVHAREASEGVKPRPQFDLRVFAGFENEEEHAIQMLKDLREEFPNSSLSLTRLQENGTNVYVPREAN